MSRGRDTSTLRLDRKVLKEIVENCSNPEAMKEILLVLPMQLALRKVTLEYVEAYWKQVGCIFWTPVDPKQRHVDVSYRDKQIENAVRGITMVHVHRIVWTATRQVISEQGSQLSGDEEIHHICGSNGQANTASGVCLNPGCLLRGDAHTRQQLQATRRILERSKATLDKIYARHA